MSEAVGELPILTIQDPTDMIGASVVDCRPTVLPVSIPLSALSPRTVENARGTSGFNPSRTEGQSIVDMDTNEITINRIVGFSWNDPGTDVEDELPTPASSPVQCTTTAVMTGESGGPQELRDNFDLDLAKVLLDISVMPTMVSPIEDSVVIKTTEVAEYATPEVPTIETVMESPGFAVPQESGIVTSWVPRYSPIPMTSSVGGEAQPMSTVQSSPYLPPVMAAPPPSCTETLDQFLPNLPSPLGVPSQSPGREDTTKEPETEVFVVEASTESPSAMGRQADQVGEPDLLREGPFEVYDVPPTSGQAPCILNSLPGCQYHMTSYDDCDSHADLDPAYGIHLYDFRLMEYMGAPESARLLGRTPEYWLEHMGRERMVAAALRLHHDASLIMTNVQVMAQFVTGLNRTASEVMRVVYDKEPFPTEAIQYVTPARRVRRAAHYMAAMGLWRPTSGPVLPGPLPVSSCNSCMSCEDCFPDVPM